jgi:hypothetical protein
LTLGSTPLLSGKTPIPKSTDYTATIADIPRDSHVLAAYGSTHLADAYEIRLPANASSDPEVLARFTLSRQSPTLKALVRMRDALVAPFGLKTAKQLRGHDPARIQLFRIFEKNATEIVLGEDDKHLDFRLSVMRRVRATEHGDEAFLILSTVVHCHNRLGRLYIMLIAPFHRRIVRSMLERAARAGWSAR